MTRIVGLVKVTLGVLIFYGMGVENLYGGGLALLAFILGAWLLISGGREILEPERVDAEADLAAMHWEQERRELEGNRGR